MITRKKKHPHEMTDKEIVSFIKSETSDTQLGYVLLTKYRSGLPGMDAKDFNQLFTNAIADDFVEYVPWEFTPTHKAKDYDMLIQVTDVDDCVVRYVTDYGGTGGSPVALFRRDFIEVEEDGE